MFINPPYHAVIIEIAEGDVDRFSPTSTGSTGAFGKGLVVAIAARSSRSEKIMTSVSSTAVNGLIREGHLIGPLFFETFE